VIRRERESHMKGKEKNKENIVLRQWMLQTVDVRLPHQTTSFTWRSQNPKHAKNFSCSAGLLSVLSHASLSLSLVRSQIQSPITCCLILTGYRTFQKKKKSRETYPDKPCVTLELGFLHFFFGIARPIILKILIQN
jgi:uncharacterized membrane protein YfcA